MKTGPRQRLTDAGFSVIELLVLVAVLGVIMAASAPFFVSYLRTSSLRAGAEDMATVLTRARQLAIHANTNMCVTSDSTRARVHIGTCAGAVWTGPGTDAAGFIRLANDIPVASAQNAVFTYLGTAAAPGTYTVTNPHDGRTLRVTVALSGRVSIGP